MKSLRFTMLLLLESIVGMRIFLAVSLLACFLLFMLSMNYLGEDLAWQFLKTSLCFPLSIWLHELGHLIPFIIFTKGKGTYLIKDGFFGVSVHTEQLDVKRNTIIAFSGPACCVMTGILLIQRDFFSGSIFLLHILNLLPIFKDGANILEQIYRKEG